MPDAGTKYTDKAQETLEKRLKTVYAQAQKEIQRKLDAYTKAFVRKDQQKREDYLSGKITLEEYQRWERGQVFIGQQWKDKLESITSTLYNANQHANDMVEGAKRAVFGENATYQAYRMETGAGIDLSFSVYDSASVTRLIKQRPELLPHKVVNGVKDKAWNKTKVANAVSQGIIQGESVSDIAKRIAKDTASLNDGAMVRYARTSMTSAQNAGRMEVLQEAKEMGIRVKKRWVATLDSRTRDAHAALDGQIQDVDKPFLSELGEIMYPGDPAADPANVWNCRCTMVYEYEDYPAQSEERAAYKEWDDEEGHHRVYEKIPNMTYKEWKAAKGSDKKDDIYEAKKELNKTLYAIAINHADKVFSGIWMQDVTYKDWEDKHTSGSIGRKRDYLQQQIDRAVQRGDTYNQEKFQKLLDELNEFDRNGLSNMMLLELRDAQEKNFIDMLPKEQVNKVTKAAKNSPFTADAYTKARKDAAVWDIPKNVDKELRGRTGEVWKAATDAEKDAIFEYTRSYHKFNEPLRGIEYGSNKYLGVGNTDLNAGRAKNGKMLNDMTKIIDKCSYDKDVWMQRGCGFGGMDKFFQVDSNLLMSGDQNQLENALLGKTVTEYGFMSCGTAKGQGFSGNPIMMNIYCPKGTKMMYVEPFSAFGGSGAGRKWDGDSLQRTFGGEFETILQQGSSLRIVKVEKSSSGTIYLDLEVIDQSKQQWYTK